MMKDFHVHTTYCDGKSTPSEIVRKAIELNLDCIGFSGHSYTFFDESYCMTKQGTEEYFTEISELKKQYEGKIQILCGIEQDYYSDMDTSRCDYVIGSVHYLKLGEEYVAVDENRETLEGATEKYFGGDIYSLAEKYFSVVSDVVSKINADIIGHFDLISKFNEGGCMFDEQNPRYIAAYKSAIDRLLKHNVPFEVNTGAISRGYKTSAYPNTQMLEYIFKGGGKVILSSDSHSADTLCFQFDKWSEIIKKTGFDV